MNNFILTDKSYEIRKKNLTDKSATERKWYLKNHLSDIQMCFHSLSELSKEIELNKHFDKKNTCISKFILFSQGKPNDENYWILGFYLFEEAMNSVKKILDYMEDDDYWWKEELKELEDLVMFYQDEPVKMQDDKWNEYDSEFTDCRYYEELNGYIDNTEMWIEKTEDKWEIFETIKKYYKTVKDLLFKISDFYNDANIILKIFLDKNMSVFNEIMGTPIFENQPPSPWFRLIELKWGLKYETWTYSFYYKDLGPYCIEWNNKYPNRLKFMNALCKEPKGTFVTYEELMNIMGKTDIWWVQTVYGNIRDGLEAYFRIKNTESEFCTNKRWVWYMLKRA